MSATVGQYATVLVDGEAISGEVYDVQANGWPCVITGTGRQASGPPATITELLAEIRRLDALTLADAIEDRNPDAAERIRGRYYPRRQEER
jgi:hypothetical protein